ncbi:MAG: DUF502 domain-containing protein [Calditrichales bacterium]|nr:MAG: DUF502 domain-containing protein [Calditrichales bacterium]
MNNEMTFFQKVKKRSKNYFLSGILLIVPIVITIIVLKSIFTFLDELLLPYLRPQLGYWVPGIGIIITLAGVYLVGILVTNFIGKKFVSLGEKFLLNIPIAKSIYGSVKQILETFSFKSEESGKKVVMVEYPRKGIWSIGLINGEIIQPENKEPLYNILILAAINPASGFFILVPKTQVTHLNITVEEAMKWIVSGGIVTPQQFLKS